MVDKLKSNIRYLFQNLPIYFLSFFKQMDSIILSFVWANKPPRNSKAHLQNDVDIITGLQMRGLLLWQWGGPWYLQSYLHHNIVNVHP